jgi:NADPH-dependent 2,4-dienoyl-CoA reductase/sulfur reductase-like enzyme
LKIGELGGVEVNEYMQTSDRISMPWATAWKRSTVLPAESPRAIRRPCQSAGRVAGENAASTNCVTFPGTIQTGICKVFDYGAGSTGLSETVAKRLGYKDIITVINASPDKPGFMEGKLLVTKLVADQKTGRVLGRTVHRSRQCRQADRPVGMGHSGENDRGGSCQRRSALRHHLSLWRLIIY